VFNIPNDQGNANQNNFEIPSQPSQNDYYQENKQQQMLVRMQWKKEPFHTLVGM
jgi:hypothetical protein